MSQPTDYFDRASLEKAAIWTSHEEIIMCFLCDGETQRPVKLKFETSDTGIINLKSIDTMYLAREHFDSLKTDIGEYFRQGYADCPYKDFRGLFENELQ